MRYAFSWATRLERVVEVKVERRHGHARERHIVHLQFDVGIDEVVGEHIPARQEFAILIERFQGLIQGGANGWDLGVFFWRQVIEILVSSFARMDLILDTVKTSHQESSKAQVRVAERIREAHLNTASFSARHMRNTNRSGTVASGVGQLHWSFKAWHQTTVGVNPRVGDGVQSTSVLDNAANVVERYIRQTSVAVTREEVRTIPEPLSPSTGLGINVAVLP